MKVLVSIHSAFAMWNIPPTYLDRLRRDFPRHVFAHATNDPEAEALIPDADAAFMGTIQRAQFEAARRLRWIHSPAAGVGGMLFPDMIASPIVITNSRGMSADTIAEHVLAVTLAIFRRLPHAFRSQASHEWAQDAISAEGHRAILNARVLIVGLGAIGAAVAGRMSMLGARVVGIRRRAEVGWGVEGVTSIVGPENLLSALPHADVVVVSAPHTRETRGLIGAHELAAMRPDAVLINVSRGQLVDEQALIDALRERRIGGAALDVFNDEPLPADSPFWTLPNVLITPHTAGWRPDHWDAAVALFAKNLRRFDAGKPLMNVVDKLAGY
jgi:phosphoglycerate dehydrogenase-like enzyme